MVLAATAEAAKVVVVAAERRVEVQRVVAGRGAGMAACGAAATGMVRLVGTAAAGTPVADPVVRAVVRAAAARIWCA
jgi:hypothetical protein